MKNGYIYIDKKEPLVCSMDNPRFILILGFYISFVETMMDFVKIDFDQAKYLFTERWGDYLQHTIDRTKGLPVCDKIDYLWNEDVLTGPYARRFGYVRDYLHKLWELFMDEDTAHAEVLSRDQVIDMLYDTYKIMFEIFDPPDPVKVPRRKSVIPKS